MHLMRYPECVDTLVVIFLKFVSKGRYSKINVYLPSNTHYSYFLFVFAPIKGSLM